MFISVFINKLKIMLRKLLKKLFGCNKVSEPSTYNVQFETDWTCNWCSPMIDPVITDTSVTFNSGRVVSTHGYKNISKITATIDLSKLAPNSIQKNNWLNASFYMVNSSIQPKGTSYCDAGNTGSPYCNEIDFLETNGNRIFQQTIHLNNQQRFEYSYTDGALDDNCYTPSRMSDNPSNGTHSLVDVLDVTIPFEMEIDFNSDYTNMTITVSQNGKSAVIYDVLEDGGADGTTIDMSSLKSTMSVGWWITPSFWEGYSPKGPGNEPWFTGSCYSDNVCDAGWTLSNVIVVAESQI
jgi:hypothetical protein